jgi:hypothetical protein
MPCLSPPANPWRPRPVLSSSLWRHDEIPARQRERRADDVAERLVHAHAVEEHREAFRRADRGARGEAAIVHIHLEGIARAVVDAHALQLRVHEVAGVERVGVADLQRPGYERRHTTPMRAAPRKSFQRTPLACGSWARAQGRLCDGSSQETLSRLLWEIFPTRSRVREIEDQCVSVNALMSLAWDSFAVALNRRGEGWSSARLSAAGQLLDERSGRISLEGRSTARIGQVQAFAQFDTRSLQSFFGQFSREAKGLIFKQLF